MRHLCRLAVIVTIILAARNIAAAQDEPNNFNNWLRREITVAATPAEPQIAANGNGVSNQRESPSVDQTSASLVDTSSASDFVSLALNVTGLRPETGSEDESTPASGSVTASLYSLIAAARGISLTDPQFYKRATHWRRVALTIGSEESKPDEHFTDKPSTNAGAKFLIINRRDLYSQYAQNQLGVMDSASAAYVKSQLPAVDKLQRLICRHVANAGVDCDDNAFKTFLLKSPFDAQNWPNTLAQINANEKARSEVQSIIDSLAAGHAVAAQIISSAVERIQRARQLAFAYYTKQREDTGTDEHRLEVIFDYGLSERLNWTINASYDYRDRKESDDTRSGRFATEFQAKLGNQQAQVWSARPVMLSGSGEVKKGSGSDALVRLQAKLVVPITSGVDVPIAYSYANRDDEEVVAGSKLKFSLAIDPVRFREGLR